MKNKRIVLIGWGIIAVCAILLAVFTGCPSSSEEITPVTTIPALNDRVGALETWKPVVDSKLATMATNDYVDSKVASVTTPDLTDLTDRIATLESWKASVDSRIAALESWRDSFEEDSGTTQPEEDVVTCDMEPVGTPSIVYDSGVTTLTAAILVTITNTGTQDLEKIEFEVYFSLYSTAGTLTFADIPTNSCSLVGDKIAEWSLTPWGISPYYPVFVNYTTSGWGTGFSLDAGEVEKVYLTLTLEYSGDVSGSLVLEEPEMECVDYEIK
jgi:hypothetical protein